MCFTSVKYDFIIGKANTTCFKTEQSTYINNDNTIVKLPLFVSAAVKNFNDFVWSSDSPNISFISSHEITSSSSSSYDVISHKSSVTSF